MSNSTSSVWHKPWLPFFATLILLTVNLVWIGPTLARIQDQNTANLVYLLIRVIALIGLSFVLSHFSGLTRVRAIALTLLTGFMDQVVIKWVWVGFDGGAASLGIPADIGMRDAFLGLMVSFVAFFPLVIILAFLGTELSQVIQRFKKK